MWSMIFNWMHVAVARSVRYNGVFETHQSLAAAMLKGCDVTTYVCLYNIYVINFPKKWI